MEEEPNLGTSAAQARRLESPALSPYIIKQQQRLDREEQSAADLTTSLEELSRSHQTVLFPSSPSDINTVSGDTSQISLHTRQESVPSLPIQTVKDQTELDRTDRARLDIAQNHHQDNHLLGLSSLADNIGPPPPYQA